MIEKSMMIAVCTAMLLASVGFVAPAAAQRELVPAAAEAGRLSSVPTQALSAAGRAADDPTGHLDGAAQAAGNRIEVNGWAADPRAPRSREQVHIYVTGPDGRVAGTPGIFTGVARPDVAAAYPWAGGAAGFDGFVPALGSGMTEVCAYAISVSPPWTNPPIGCLWLQVQIVPPRGMVDSVSVSGASAVVNGWTFDPNRPSSAIPVHIYVTNGWTTNSYAFTADDARPDVNRAYAIAGNHGYSRRVALPGGGNQICAYGIGENGNNGLLGWCWVVQTPFKWDAAARGAVVAANFDNMAMGAANPASINAALGATNKNASAYDDVTIVDDGRGGRAMRTTLRAGTIHSSNGGDSGTNLFVNLPGTFDRACLQYDIRFDSNFDWSLGGKLPGLEGVVPGIPPASPTGGDVTDLGWSGRLMWVGPKAYSWAGSTNMAVSYMYHVGQAGTYGDNIRWNRAFVAGQWHTVRQCYAMNNIGAADGQLGAWMDGQQVVSDNNFVYRSRGDVHINYLAFSIFRGGNTANWAGSQDGYVDIDNLLISGS